ncbi:MAG: hypothetical protein ACRENP_09600 [Longimicrobiales bacterium]
MPIRSLGTAILVALAAAAPVSAQVRVNPTGVNVNAQGATTVFLSYGGLAGYEAVDAFWCGALTPASPDVGLRCDAGTIFGQLPLRYDRSTVSGTNALTDIMTIPHSVTRRAYQAAEAGAPSAFYYVRRFRSLTGGRDQYVAVTCRMTDGGARSPLSLTDVRLSFLPETPVLHVAAGEPLPAIEAAITYTGTGRLTGRWEIVLPGEDLPTTDDLLTEATLPPEQRGTQRRYRQLERFNEFLPPTGRVVVPGPKWLPTSADGVYHVLLRIEVSSEKEGNSDLTAAGAGQGIVAAGAVAGFPMPMLRYVVGSGLVSESASTSRETLPLLAPAPQTALDRTRATAFSWETLAQAALYRIEFQTEDGTVLLSALVPGELASYAAPPLLAERAAGRTIRWRVVATDAAGRELARSAWRAHGWQSQ